MRTSIDESAHDSALPDEKKWKLLPISAKNQTFCVTIGYVQRGA
jgi:hypothetical protein